MDDIYFRKVIARGIGKRESSVELSRGLNIICGPSNTGKTLIFKVFKQVFGAENKKGLKNDDEPFIIENDTGYTDFSLVISKNGDDVMLTRKIDSDIISVESNSPYVESGDYAYTTKRGYKLINEALLQIFNVEPFKLPSKKDGTPTSFSLKFLDYLFLADEERIDKGSQILLFHSQKYDSTTQSQANLLYLLYDLDFSHFLKNEDTEKATIRRGAVRKYINARIESNQKEISSLEKKLKELPMVESDSNVLQSELDKIREKIDGKYKESSDLEGSIRELSEKMESDGMLIGRLESLSSQYTSDLERLNFIISGKDDLDSNEEEHECPYCHSRIREEKGQVSIEEFKNEAKSALNNLNDVSETLSDLLKENKEDEKKHKAYQEKLSEVGLDIGKLSKERENLESTLRRFDELIECQKRIKYLQNDNENLEKDLFEISGQVKVKREEFKPSELFQASFFQAMTTNIRGIMGYCGDQRYISTEFDRASFDISVRGQSKSANNGKGYRSFLNSVTLLSFRKFLDEKGKHRLPVYVLDSPLKNLDVGVLDRDNIKDRFFRYLTEASRLGQLIIIENTNNFTMTDELRQNANVIEFTHGAKEGRYGFLLDHHD